MAVPTDRVPDCIYTLRIIWVYDLQENIYAKTANYGHLHVLEPNFNAASGFDHCHPQHANRGCS